MKKKKQNQEKGGVFLFFFKIRNRAHLELRQSKSSAGFEEKLVPANTFWNVAGTFFLSSNSVLSWKFCNLLYKLLHDGHHNIPEDYLLPVARLGELGHMWNHRHDCFGWLVATCIMLIMGKLDFHVGRPVFPLGLAVMDGELGTAGASAIGTIFQLTVELFDYMDSEFSPFEAGFASLDPSRSVSMTQAGQCHLAPLTQVIPDPSLLVSHSREVQLWCDGKQRPDTRVSALAEDESPVVLILGEEEPEVEPEPEPQPLLIPEPRITEGPNEKDLLIESLFQEIRALSTELQSFKTEGREGGERVPASPLQGKERATLTPPLRGPRYSPPKLHHEPRVPHARLGTKPTTLVRCRTTEHPLPLTVRNPAGL
uniref:AP180 N-terminal homology (ANTH) domain-containing protein n=1 Tax=Eptatretus burgeri TaxID=7764 RepID=A0A8C4QAY6_EPTBU